MNNKRRRAAKRRKNDRRSTHPGPQAAPAWDPVEDTFAVADRGVAMAVRVLSGRKSDDTDARQQAELLERRLAGERHVLEIVTGMELTRLVEQAVDGGWGPGDLAQLVSRRAHARHLPTLAAALHHDRRDHDRGVEWQAVCDRVGPDARLLLPSTALLASALRVAAVLAVAPRLAVPASQTVDAGMTHPKLAKVRALLAKAESTQFDEEAEALSAKAQELITRYALDHLLQGGRSSGDEGQQVRRLWLDAPYTRAKANLVHVVAEANRCRAAFAASCDFSVVVGAAHDIEAVELLVTSLLVQADAAMVRHSRQTSGRARTRSFRQSFLLAYAARIGERLRTATQDAVDARGDGRLLPALLDHDAKVEAAFDAMVPHRAAAGPSVTSADGWAAGTVAADLARLDASAKLTGTRDADYG